MKKLGLFVVLMLIAYTTIVFRINNDPEFARYVSTIAYLVGEEMMKYIIIASSGLMACIVYTIYDVVYNVIYDTFSAICNITKSIFTKRTA